MPGKQVELLHSAVMRVSQSHGKWIMSRLTNLVFLPFVLDWLEWTSRCDEGLAIRPLVDILRLSLVETGWIAKGKNNGPLDVFGHFADDVF